LDGFKAPGVAQTPKTTDFPGPPTQPPRVRVRLWHLLGLGGKQWQALPWLLFRLWHLLGLGGKQWQSLPWLLWL